MWVGGYVRIRYASLIKKWLCWFGVCSSKQTILDVKGGNPAQIPFFSPCKVILNADANRIIPPPVRQRREGSMGACGWQLGMMGWLFSWDKHIVSLFLFDDCVYWNGAKLQTREFRCLGKIADLILI